MGCRDRSDPAVGPRQGRPPATVMEALRRAKYKFPGRQRLCASENWGFTKLRRDQYVALKALGQLVKNGVDTKVASLKGPLGPNELQKLPMSMLGDGSEE